jgi:hypothetical protein
MGNSVIDYRQLLSLKQLDQLLLSRDITMDTAVNMTQEASDSELFRYGRN